MKKKINFLLVSNYYYYYLIFLHHFNMLISKINFKNKKNITLIYFHVKNTLKNN